MAYFIPGKGGPTSPHGKLPTPLLDQNAIARGGSDSQTQIVAALRTGVKATYDAGATAISYVGGVMSPSLLAGATYGLTAATSASRMGVASRRFRKTPFGEQLVPESQAYTREDDEWLDEYGNYFPSGAIQRDAQGNFYAPRKLLPKQRALPPPETPATIKPQPTNPVFQGPSPSSSGTSSGGGGGGGGSPVQTASANHCVFAAAVAAVASYAAYTFLKR